MYTLEQKLGASILRTIPIEYCLTVPAIWSEVAKEKTLAAASRAGLNGVGNMLLVSEPVSSDAHWFSCPSLLRCRRKQQQPMLCTDLIHTGCKSAILSSSVMLEAEL